MSDLWHILIVDDEDLARRRVRRFLAETELPHTVAEAANGLEALDQVAAFAPQIVFLDVQMPGLSGFDVLFQLDERPFRVVFQTAFDEFAVRAFEENACDYLLKPFSRERFAKALARAREQVLGASLSGLRVHLGDERQYLTRLGVKSAGVRIMIDVETVDCFVSKDHYTCIFAGGKEHLTEVSLGRLVGSLDPRVFVRVHRNAIVNTRSVLSLARAGEDTVALRNGHKVPVSRRCRARLIAALR